MLSNISYKLSTFADYSSLSYSKDKLVTMLNAFPSIPLIPNIIQGINGTGHQTQRMRFSTNDGLTIALLEERIDVCIVSQDIAGFSSDEVQKVQDRLVCIMKAIFEAFDCITMSNRMALYVEYVYFDLTDEQKNNYRDKFLNKVKYYSDKLVDEFAARYVGRITKKIDGNDEIVNVITSIDYWLSNLLKSDKPVSGYHIDMDINTFQDNRKYRFGVEALSDFMNEANAVRKELEKEFIDEYR